MRRDGYERNVLDADGRVGTWPSRFRDRSRIRRGNSGVVVFVIAIAIASDFGGAVLIYCSFRLSLGRFRNIYQRRATFRTGLYKEPDSQRYAAVSPAQARQPSPA